MHEFSLVHALLKKVEEVAAAEEAERVKSVRLRVGPLAGVDPYLLREAFRFLSRGGIADGARLDLHIPPLEISCPACGVKKRTEKINFLCPECGSPAAPPAGEGDLILERIEIEQG